MREARCVVCDGRVFDVDDAVVDLEDALRVHLCREHRKKAHFVQSAATGRWIYHQDYGPQLALGWPEEV